MQPQHLRVGIRHVIPTVAFGLFLTSCASPGGPDVAIVEITPTGFQPVTLTVAPGTEVRWTNTTPTAHTVRSAERILPDQEAVPDGAEPFDSGRVLENETFAYLFEVEGDYLYESEYQEQMAGTIRVVEP